MTRCLRCSGSGLARNGDDVEFCDCDAGFATYRAALDRALGGERRMNGPEHYTEAERDIERANNCEISDGTAAFMLARAQVHATLAAAAAAAHSDESAAQWRTAGIFGSPRIGETQEAGSPATVLTEPAGARDPEGGASSSRTGEEGGAAGARADRPAPLLCYQPGCTTPALVIESIHGERGTPPVLRRFCTRHAVERGLL